MLRSRCIYNSELKIEIHSSPCSALSIIQYQMEGKQNGLLMTPVHRILMITLIIVQHIGYIWGMMLFINYTAYRIPFMNYPSIITAEGSSTHYLKNASLYVAFWLQHILMATLKYKIAIFKKIKCFVLYERYIYNISSSLAMWFIYSQVELSNVYLFTLSSWISVPCAVLTLYLLGRSVIQLGDKILMPYQVADILNSKYIPYNSYESKALPGVKMDGIYAYVRHPLQTGMLGLMMFMNGVYTTDRLLYLAVMGGGVLIGVFLEEQRMLVMYKDYKHYMETVKARFVPFMHALKL